MLVRPENLDKALKKLDSSVFLVASDEILLQNEACDAIRAAARKHNFNQRDSYLVERDFDWQHWWEESNAMSLFSEQRLIEIKLTASKGQKEAADSILKFVTDPPPDVLLLITCPRITKAQEKTRWIKAIIDNGCYVPIYGVDVDKLPAWLAARAKKLGLKLAPDAQQLLADRVEGNLLAANQELEKLALLFNSDELVSAEMVGKSVADSSRFSAYTALDHALAGDNQSSSHALRRLKEEGLEAMLINGAIAAELRKLSMLKNYETNNQLDAGLQKSGVIFSKKKVITQTVQRLSTDRLRELVRLCSRADVRIKTGELSLAWDSMEAVLLGIAGVRLDTTALLLSEG